MQTGVLDDNLVCVQVREIARPASIVVLNLIMEYRRIIVQWSFHLTLSNKPELSGECEQQFMFTISNHAISPSLPMQVPHHQDEVPRSCHRRRWSHLRARRHRELVLHPLSTVEVRIRIRSKSQLISCF